MATYLQGVTDYIPHIQPFKPDYNFYQKALETKQAQYKAGQDKISNLYGTLLNSEMLRESNNVKREDFFKAVQNDIQRMSSVDLSLEENVDTAFKVFQPIIDDKNITRDMAWTKNYRNEKQKGEYFRNCLDEKKCGGKWWKEGDQALDYMANDFSKSDDATAMGFTNPRYTPFVNAQEKAMNLIKDLAPNVQSVSHDPSGKWIYTTKNGDQLTGPLYHYLTGIIGNDPSIKDVFSTKSYLARKNYIANKASEFGSEDAAEADYLNRMSSAMFDQHSKNEKEVSSTLDYLDALYGAAKEDIKQNGVNPKTDKSKLDAMATSTQQSALLNSVKDFYKNSASNVEGDLQGIDRESLRRRVDGAVSSGLLNDEMKNSAMVYSSTHSSTEVKEDPYTMASYKNSLDMQRDDRKFLHDLDLISAREMLKNGKKGNSDPRLNIVAPGNPGSHNTDPDAPLSEVSGEATRVVEGDLMEKQTDYVNTTYKQLTIAATNTEMPDKARLAKEKLKSIFGSLLDENYKLKDNFQNDPAFTRSTSQSYYGTLYSKAIATNKQFGNLVYQKGDLDSLSKKQASAEESAERYQLFDEDVVFNNREVIKYMKNTFKDPSTAFAVDMLIKPDGHIRGHDEFRDVFYKTNARAYPRQDDLYSAMESAWENVSGKFSKSMDSNKILSLKNVNSSGYQAMGGGGMGAVPLRWRVDASDPTKIGYKNTLESIADYDGATSVLAGGNHSKDDIKGTSVEAKGLMDLFYDELQSLNYKDRKRMAPIAEVNFQGVAADSRNTMGYTVKFDPQWLNSISTKTTNKGVVTMHGPAAFLWDTENQKWKDDPSVSFYTPADKTMSSVSRTVKEPVSIWELKIRKGPIALTKPLGGSMQINKTSDGYMTSGYFYAVKNGERVKIAPPEAVEAIGRTKNLNVMVANLNGWLEDQEAENQKAMENYARAHSMTYDELAKKHPDYFR
jgi:hypothetical protein